MHKKNQLKQPVLWFVTWRGSSGHEVSAHSSRAAAQKRVLNLVEYGNISLSETHIYAGIKVTEVECKQESKG